MARKKRVWYQGQILHVMNRGGNHEGVFLDEQDAEYFLILIKDVMMRYPFKLHAYCLMPNHYHMLVETMDIEIWHIMKRINQMYACYFNKRYQRDGSVFRGRYKAIEILDAAYFMQVSRYICLNPVKAHMVNRPEEYVWSSYRTLIGMDDDELTDCTRTYSLFEMDSCEKYKQFVESKEFVNEEKQVCEEIGDSDPDDWNMIKNGSN